MVVVKLERIYFSLFDILDLWSHKWIFSSSSFSLGFLTDWTTEGIHKVVDIGWIEYYICGINTLDWQSVKSVILSHIKLFNVSCIMPGIKVAVLRQGNIQKYKFNQDQNEVFQKHTPLCNSNSIRIILTHLKMHIHNICKN